MKTMRYLYLSKFSALPMLLLVAVCLGATSARAQAPKPLSDILENWEDSF